jgi:hypothetical protein
MQIANITPNHTQNAIARWPRSRAGGGSRYADYLEGKATAPDLGDYYLKGRGRGRCTRQMGGWSRGDRTGLGTGGEWRCDALVDGGAAVG